MRQALRGGVTDSSSPPLSKKGEDEFDRSLRPRLSTISSARSGSRPSSISRSRQRGAAPIRSTTCCWSARRASARRASPTSCGKSSASASAASRVRRWSARATWPRSSPRSSRATCCSSTRSIGSSSAVEEILYPALEDFRLDIIVGQGHAARTLTLDLPPFTLVGATTRTGLLTTPLRDRFGMTFRLGYYEPDELSRSCVARRASSASSISDDAAEEIARRSRGTPRVANRILRRVRDVAEVRHEGEVTTEVAEEALTLLEVDGEGLERVDRELLCDDRATNLRAGRWGCPRSRSLSARSATPSRMSTSRTCCSSASSNAHPEAGVTSSGAHTSVPCATTRCSDARSLGSRSASPRSTTSSSASTAVRRHGVASSHRRAARRAAGGSRFLRSPARPHTESGGSRAER